jgi:hypothetical protein
MAYPDGPDISPSLVTSSGTLSLGPGMTNLSTLSGLTTFFPQEDAANLMAINEEQTTATTPLGDDLAALNTIKATFHRLCVVLPEPLSLWLTSSLVGLHAMATRLCIKPSLDALATATNSTMAIKYQATTAALKGGKPAASKTPATTMVDLTSSTTMTALTSATALPCHIITVGCRTHSF